MIPKYNKIHNRFLLNGIHYDHVALQDVAYSFVKEGDPYEKIMGDFLLDWMDDRDYILVKTSGSTGLPKTIQLGKQAMVYSAIATGDYFKLSPGDSAFHCLPSEFIAGKMMLIRAFILGLELDIIEPSSYPLSGIKKKYDFSAMVPMQAANSIDQLNQIKVLLIGGAFISNQLIDKIQGLKTKVYETFGMTETMTHIAVKPLNLKKKPAMNASPSENSTLEDHASFHTLPNISVSQDERNCLVIDAPNLIREKLVTNDLVKLISDTEFKWLGRIDNVINSGGVKLFPEQIEAKLSAFLKNRFFITAKNDTDLGDRLVLVIEGPDDDLAAAKSKLDEITTLNTYEIPKEVYVIPKFKLTRSGKIQREKTLSLLD